MALIEKKILESERNSVYVKSTDGDRLVGTVTENKNVFDRYPELIRSKYNELIDLLIACGLDTLASDMANRYTKDEANALVDTETKSLVADVAINLTTGAITITKKDGTFETIDTALEKVPATFEFVEDGANDKFYLQVTNVDGTSTRTELTNLMNQYTFQTGDTITFTVTKNGTTTTVQAEVVAKSITFDKLADEVSAYITESVNAVAADRAFVESARVEILDASQTVTNNTSIVVNARDEAVSSKNEAKSYAVGGTGTRSGEDTDNAKYYAREAALSASKANNTEVTIRDYIEIASAAAETATTNANLSALSVNAATNASANAIAAAEQALASEEQSRAFAETAITKADEAAGFADVAQSAKTDAEQARDAAIQARNEAQHIAGGDFAGVAMVTIPAGRMRGDIDGDGKITETDFEIIDKHVSGTELIADEDMLLCADVTGEGTINFVDKMRVQQFLLGNLKLGASGTEVLGNWTVNANYKTEEAQFYTDIPVDGMTASSSAIVTVKGTFDSGFFTKAECVTGAVRIYAKLCPIEAVEALVVFGSGDGSAVITIENETPVVPFYSLTIPAGRMKGDVDGDGKFTDVDKRLIGTHEYVPLTDETQLICADISGDGKINITDEYIVYEISIGTRKVGQFCTDITGNWAVNPNYATEEAQFYTDIHVPRLDSLSDVLIIVEGDYTFTIPAYETLRVWAKLCPIADVNIKVNHEKGTGRVSVVNTATPDAETARTKLDVYSKAEVEQLIADAIANL